VTVSYGVLVYAYPVLLSPMERELDWSRGQTSVALSVAFLVSALASIPAGRWLDRRGPRQLMTAGSLLVSAAAVLAFVVGFGVVRGLTPLVGATLLADFYGPASYGTISGVVAFFAAIVQALALGGIGLLHDHFHGYRQAIWLLAGAAAVAALAGLLAERTAPRQRERWVGA